MLGVAGGRLARRCWSNWLVGRRWPLAAIVFYVVVYTMLLKRRTPQNIVWGGAAGCMPVLIGWAAVTGSLAWAPFVLFARHLLLDAAALLAAVDALRDDYAAAGVPMLPVVAGAGSVGRQIVAYRG